MEKKLKEYLRDGEKVVWEGKTENFPLLDDAMKTNPMKGEYYLPGVVSQLLTEEKARVRVLSSKDKWYGVTYQEDKPVVVEALTRMRQEGLYPMDLWNE